MGSTRTICGGQDEADVEGSRGVQWLLGWRALCDEGKGRRGREEGGYEEQGRDAPHWMSLGNPPHVTAHGSVPDPPVGRGHLCQIAFGMCTSA